MYVRVTTYDANTDKLEEGTQKLEGMLPEIMAIPGMKHYYSAGRADDGKCVVIAVYESQQAAEAALPKARELFGRFADLLASTPQAEGYDVLAQGHN